MKSLFSAIARAISATATVFTTVMRYCRDTGRWVAESVAKTVGAIGGCAGQATPVLDIVGDNDNGTDALLAQSKALVESVEVPKNEGGDGYDRIQRACRALCAGDEPATADLEYITPLQREWLNLMTPEMRLIVGNVDRDDVIAHMRGGKGLRGVMRSDVESVNEWKAMLHREMEGSRNFHSASITMEQDDVPALRHVG